MSTLWNIYKSRLVIYWSIQFRKFWEAWSLKWLNDEWVEFVAKSVHFLSKGLWPLFLDEAVFGAYNKRERTWPSAFCKEFKLFARNKTSDTGFLTALAIVSNDHGIELFQILDQPVNINSFQKFLPSLFEELDPISGLGWLRDSFIILDNASYHRSR